MHILQSCVTCAPPGLLLSAAFYVLLLVCCYVCAPWSAAMYVPPGLLLSMCSSWSAAMYVPPGLPVFMRLVSFALTTNASADACAPPISCMPCPPHLPTCRLPDITAQSADASLDNLGATRCPTILPLVPRTNILFPHATPYSQHATPMLSLATFVFFNLSHAPASLRRNCTRSLTSSSSSSSSSSS